MCRELIQDEMYSASQKNPPFVLHRSRSTTYIMIMIDFELSRFLLVFAGY